MSWQYSTCARVCTAAGDEVVPDSVRDDEEDEDDDEENEDANKAATEGDEDGALPSDTSTTDSEADDTGKLCWLGRQGTELRFSSILSWSLLWQLLFSNIGLTKSRCKLVIGAARVLGVA